MSQRIIKNYTNEDLVIGDLGDLLVPRNGASDIGGDETRLVRLASSDDLLAALAQGIDKYQVSDGARDFSLAEGIDCIRKIQVPTRVDPQGKWRVRVDSMRENYDVVFVGAGDDLANGVIGAGEELTWDFGTQDGLVGAPSGFKRKRLDFQFMDGIYVKDGTIRWFNAPRGAYLDFFIVCPAGYYYDKKWVDSDGNLGWTYHEATEPTVFAHWMVKHWMEGNTTTGYRLSTETSSDVMGPQYLIWRAEVTTPEVAGFDQFHGSLIMEIYRARTIAWPS